jgi:hypothetical protein
MVFVRDCKVQYFLTYEKGNWSDYPCLRILDIAAQEVLVSRFPEDIESEIIVN